MTPGLFDLPAPLLEWVDQRLSAVFPAPVTIALWAMITGIVCLELYRLLSPQARIERLKDETRVAQRQLTEYDGEFEGAWPLIRHLLGVSLQRVGIVLPATLLAGYPVIAVLIWMSNSHGRQVIAAGPEWLRGWEVVFLPVMFVAALVYKSARRIH